MLDPLITAADLTDYGYTVDAGVVDGLIARASARVRRFVRMDITEGTATDVRLPGAGPWLLPQRPVQSVTSVDDQDGNALVAGTDYELHGQILYARCAFPNVVVTFDYGYTELPDGLVELICQIVNRMATQPAGLLAGATQEQGGSESISWGSDAWAGVCGLTDGEAEALRAYFPCYPQTTIPLALGTPTWRF